MSGAKIQRKRGIKNATQIMTMPIFEKNAKKEEVVEEKE